MLNNYVIGNVVRITVEFRNRLGYTDPDKVYVRVTDPNNVVTVYSYPSQVIYDTKGHYHIDVPASIVGCWYYYGYSTGNGAASVNGSYNVT